MVARPIGLHVLRPAQANRAYDVLAAKLWGAPSAVGRGLQLIPDEAR